MASVLDKQLRTPVGDAPVVPVALIVGGLYLCWFAVHYWASDTKWPSDPIKAILRGEPLPVPDRSATDKALQDLQGAAKAGSTLGTATGGILSEGVGALAAGGRIAEAALKYQGQGYAFGGPADVPGHWDCSSFVSYVLGHDVGRPLPGGGTYGSPGYPPHTHGPITNDYLLFGQAVTLSQVEPGDLVVSSQHMGIVTGKDTYMSAHSPATGTHTSSFLGDFPGGPPVYRRVV
jgi:hypothetical protein